MLATPHGAKMMRCLLTIILDDLIFCSEHRAILYLFSHFRICEFDSCKQIIVQCGKNYLPPSICYLCLLTGTLVPGTPTLIAGATNIFAQPHRRS